MVAMAGNNRVRWMSFEAPLTSLESVRTSPETMQFHNERFDFLEF